MGKEYVYVKQNGFKITDAYKRLLAYQIIETSEEKLFNKTIAVLRPFEIEEIELGTNNTKETILRLSNNGFAVLNGTIDIKTLGC
jgi:hypothetical protein